MFPNKKAISQQINTAIRERWCKECSEILGQLVIQENKEATDIVTDNNYPIQNVNTVTLGRLKERIEALEELNDHLYYYLCFLVENLPELIIRTIKSGFDLNDAIEDRTERPDSNEDQDLDPEKKFDPPHPTRRENDVLELLEKGFCAKEIARKLFISESTVITHKKNLKKKFNVRNTAELISKIKNKRADKIIRVNFLDHPPLQSSTKVDSMGNL